VYLFLCLSLSSRESSADYDGAEAGEVNFLVGADTPRYVYATACPVGAKVFAPSLRAYDGCPFKGGNVRKHAHKSSRNPSFRFLGIGSVVVVGSRMLLSPIQLPHLLSKRNLVLYLSSVYI